MGEMNLNLDESLGQKRQLAPGLEGGQLVQGSRRPGAMWTVYQA